MADENLEELQSQISRLQAEVAKLDDLAKSLRLRKQNKASVVRSIIKEINELEGEKRNFPVGKFPADKERRLQQLKQYERDFTSNLDYQIKQADLKLRDKKNELASLLSRLSKPEATPIEQSQSIRSRAGQFIETSRASVTSFATRMAETAKSAFTRSATPTQTSSLAAGQGTPTPEQVQSTSSNTASVASQGTPTPEQVQSTSSNTASVASQGTPTPEQKQSIMGRLTDWMAGIPRGVINDIKNPEQTVRTKEEQEKFDKELADLGKEYNKLRLNARLVSKEWERHKRVIDSLKSPFASMLVSIIATVKSYNAERAAKLKKIEQLKKEGKIDEANAIASTMKTDALMRTIKITNELSRYMQQLVKAIRDTQREFAIAAGQAASLRVANFAESVKSFSSAIFTAGKTVPITAAEIQRAQLDFQEQFGMILDARQAEDLAAEAKQLGLTTRQLAEARRVFLTQSMGDVSQAGRLEEEFRKGFEDVLGPGGAKAAFEFIGKNSELMARSGTRFQQSLIRAAAEAKKIGVDLGKVNQVGDNIIGNFEGFLESMAELGAMGFGFDSTRLAMVAETGDTSALFQELQSQLAMTGKDLSDLRRSEQLALSRAFGMSIEEFQRMAGEEFDDPVDLQKEANGILKAIKETLEKVGTRLTNLGEAFGGILTPLLAGANWALQISLLSGIFRNTLNLPGALGISGVSGKLGTAGRVGGAAAGIGIGTSGIMAAHQGAKEDDLTTSILGGLGSVGGYALTGAMIGGPKGAAIGALVGFLAAGGSYMMGMGDDVVSRPGYGERTLVTPTGNIALNNDDNVVAYADDMIARNTGIELLSKGAITSNMDNPAPVVNVDNRDLKAAIVDLRKAISSLEVRMDGDIVGRVVAKSEARSMVGVGFSVARG